MVASMVQLATINSCRPCYWGRVLNAGDGLAWVTVNVSLGKDMGSGTLQHKRTQQKIQLLYLRKFNQQVFFVALSDLFSSSGDLVVNVLIGFQRNGCAPVTQAIDFYSATAFRCIRVFNKIAHVFFHGLGHNSPSVCGFESTLR